MPCVLDLAHEGRVDDEIPERCDEGHVRSAEAAAGLDVDSQLSLVMSVAVVDPDEVDQGVHGLVGELSGPLGIGAIERCEAGWTEVRAPYLLYR